MKPKLKKRLSSDVFLCAVIAAILFFNIIIGVAADKIQLRWDLTENKIFALTKETKTLLSSLTEEVTIYYFVSPGYEQSDIKQTLDMYKTASNQLRILNADPNADPVFARRFTDKGAVVQQNTIIVERGDRYRVISPADIYQSYTTQSGNTLNKAYFNIEQNITRAIAYVESNKVQKVCFTVGHNEADYVNIMDILEEENIETFQIDLKTTDIPADMDAIYIMAPSADFSEDELLRLDAFLSTGKGAQVCFDARKKPLPLLEKYLSSYWGATLYHDIVCEGDESRIVNYSYMFLPAICQSAVSDEIYNGNQHVLWPFSRSLSITETENVTATVVAQTSDKAISRHGSDRNVTENIREGVLPVSALFEKTLPDNKHATLYVSGAYQPYDSSFLEEGSLANRNLLYGVIRHLNHDDASALSITPKSLLLHSMIIGDSLTTIYIVLVCVLPALIVFTLGIIRWRRRRHL
ncbi:MAG: GldG family protein [Clostridia bacterium]|nr:GldG family protein [Clostridia bacterium]